MLISFMDSIFALFCGISLGRFVAWCYARKWPAIIGAHITGLKFDSVAQRVVGIRALGRRLWFGLVLAIALCGCIALILNVSGPVFLWRMPTFSYVIAVILYFIETRLERRRLTKMYAAEVRIHKDKETETKRQRMEQDRVEREKAAEERQRAAQDAAKIRSQTPGTKEYAELHPITDWRDLGDFDATDFRHQLFAKKIESAVSSAIGSRFSYSRQQLGDADVQLRMFENEAFRVQDKRTIRTWRMTEYANNEDREDSFEIALVKTGDVVLSIMEGFRSDFDVEENAYRGGGERKAFRLMPGPWIDFALNDFAGSLKIGDAVAAAQAAERVRNTNL